MACFCLYPTYGYDGLDKDDYGSNLSGPDWLGPTNVGMHKSFEYEIV